MLPRIQATRASQDPHYCCWDWTEQSPHWSLNPPIPHWLMASTVGLWGWLAYHTPELQNTLAGTKPGNEFLESGKPLFIWFWEAKMELMADNHSILEASEGAWTGEQSNCPRIT